MNKDKKLSYRKGSARRTMSVEILSTAAQQYAAKTGGPKEPRILDGGTYLPKRRRALFPRYSIISQNLKR